MVTTSSAVIERPSRPPTLSLVNSSHIESTLNGRPPALVSNMKSSAHLAGQLRLQLSRRHLAVPHSPSLG
jgi:hypothetical protein